MELARIEADGVRDEVAGGGRRRRDSTEMSSSGLVSCRSRVSKSLASKEEGSVIVPTFGFWFFEGFGFR